MTTPSKQIQKLTPWLIEPEDLTPHSQGLSNPYPGPSHPIPRIDNNFFKILNLSM